MRAAVYARYSSENQREQSIEDQIRVCRGFAARDGIGVLENHIYFDEAQSGSVRSRPGLEALKRAAEDRQSRRKRASFSASTARSSPATP